MAVTVHNTTFTGEAFTPLDFAVLIEHLCGHGSGILYGCEVKKTSDTAISVGEGWCLVKGRLIRVDGGSMNIALASSGTLTRYIRIKVDLSNASGSAVCENADSRGTDSSNFNVDKGVAYVTLATLSISNIAITSVTNEKLMERTPIIRNGPSMPNNSLGVDGDVYIQY